MLKFSLINGLYNMLTRRLHQKFKIKSYELKLNQFVILLPQRRRMRMTNG